MKKIKIFKFSMSSFSSNQILSSLYNDIPELSTPAKPHAVSLPYKVPHDKNK